MRTVIASRRVVLGPDRHGSLRVVPARVIIEGSRIAAVDEGAAVEEPDDRVEDVGDMVVAPAFVNAHTHLALGFLRGLDLRAAARGNMVEQFFFEVEQRLSPEDVRAFVRMGAYESLLAGVGLVWEHYYVGEHVAEALLDVGLPGVIAPTLQDLAGPGRLAWEAQLETTAQIDADSSMAERGVVAALGPHASDTVSESLFGKALDLAEARRLPLHAHLAQSIEEYRRARERHGTSPARWLERIGVLARSPQNVFAHCLYVDRDELALLASQRAATVFCPYSQLVFGFPAPAGEWSEAGIAWAIGTDCASNNDSMSVQKELRLAAGQRTVGTTWSSEYARLIAGDRDAAESAWARRTELCQRHERDADPSALLARVWSIPGSWHPKLRAGVIEAGALASLLVLDTDHPALWPAHDPLQAIAMADPSPAIWTMYLAGRRIGTPGAFHESIVKSPELTAARRDASARLARLSIT
jgi:5-methylthioadenosine/S-adenosylhomocysteine deaminase